MAILKLLENTNLEGYCLIIPTVSVGNVPQLTIDLLISTLNLKKSGILYHPAIIPAVGADPFGNSLNLCTACELYTDETLKLAVLQLRSGLEFKLVTKFCQDLKADLIEYKLSKIIVLSSGFDYELHMIHEGKFFYIAETENEPLNKLGVRQMPQNEDYSIPGGGFSVTLYEILKTICDCSVLVKFVSEGDNRPDALSVLNIVVNCIDNLKNVKLDESLKIPDSWSRVFGGPPPLGMY